VAGHVRALTSFFTVPKGDRDVRVVYNGTKSGLNDCLWAPWFRLPTVEQHLRAVTPGTFLSDVDIGEQFHNVVMHAKLQPYAGVDVTSFFPEEFLTSGPGKRVKRTLWLRWTRCGMGFKISPYNAGQAMLFAEEHIRGDPGSAVNCFRFDAVQFNIPGAPDYNPRLPWVFKLRTEDGKIANDLFVYVDDVRTTGDSYDSCWLTSRTVASRYNYLGLQDAPRKRRAPSVEAGPWAGSTIHTVGERVTVTVTMDRWRKAQQMIQWIQECCVMGLPLDHKRLESYRGSLVYLSRTYPSLVPYLKGIHLTLDSWRPHRDSAGWKISGEDMLPFQPHACTGAPSTVHAVPQLLDDIEALVTMFAPDLPPPSAQFVQLLLPRLFMALGTRQGLGLGPPF